MHFEAGHRYRIKLEWTKDQNMETMQLLWKPPASSSATSLWSEVGDGIDYYFVYGPELDKVVAGYRRVTGPGADDPALGAGALAEPAALRDLEGEPRRRRRLPHARHPLRHIVQDWFYWKEDSWGSHEFDPARFPDPDEWVRDIHAEHAR